MKRVLLYLLSGFIFVLLQGTVLKSLLPSMFVPNLVLALVVFIAFHEVSAVGALLAFLVGLLLDLSSGILIGPWASAFILVFCIFASAARRIFVESPVTAFVATFISSLLANGVYLALVHEFRPVEWNALSLSFVEAVITGMCGPILFRMMRGILTPRVQHLPGRRLSIDIA